jgi:hypothetical protein
MRTPLVAQIRDCLTDFTSDATCVYDGVEAITGPKRCELIRGKASIAVSNVTEVEAHVRRFVGRQFYRGISANKHKTQLGAYWPPNVSNGQSHNGERLRTIYYQVNGKRIQNGSDPEDRATWLNNRTEDHTAVHVVSLM